MKQSFALFWWCSFVIVALSTSASADVEVKEAGRRRKRNRGKKKNTPKPTPAPTPAPTLAAVPTCGGQSGSAVATPTNSPTNAVAATGGRKRNRKKKKANVIKFNDPSVATSDANAGRKKRRKKNKNKVVATPVTGSPTSRPTSPGIDLCTEPEIDPIAVSCPASGTGPMQLSSNITGGDFVELTPFANGLCTLWRVGASLQERTPIARSYDGNLWELYGNTLAGELYFDCEESDCVLRLPSLEGNGDYFEMMAIDYAADSTEALNARFLEQATFGPTQGTIDGLSSQSLAKWTEEQMGMEYFSHRAYYRQRLNSRTNTVANQGVGSRPCTAGAKYRKYAFTDKDRQKDVEFQIDSIAGVTTLLIKNQTRTVLQETALNLGENNPIADGSVFEICFGGVNPNLQSEVKLQVPGGKCQPLMNSKNEVITNPKVFFTEQIKPTNPSVDLNGKVKVISSSFFPEDEQSQELLLEVDLDDEVCALFPEVTGWPTFEVAGQFNGEWYLFDPRWDMYDNTIAMPKADGGGALQEATLEAVTERFAETTLCGNTEISFLNEDGCYLSDAPGVCSAVAADDVDDSIVQAKVQLTRGLLANVYRRDFGLFYAVKQLRQDEGVPYGSPCTPSTRSRWIPVRDRECSKGTPGSTTVSTLSSLLSAVNDPNSAVRDIFTPAIGTTCDAQDLTKFDFQVLANGTCWENVHQDYLQVFDFTPWLDIHRGGRAALLQFAEAESPRYELLFPASHEMNRWHVTGKPFRENIGRFGDTVQLLLPLRIVQAVGGEIVVPLKTSIPSSGVVCGSPNEVSNDPSVPGVVEQGAFDTATRRDQTTRDFVLKFQKAQVWMQGAMYAPDQLRQKVAWTLAQLLVITPDALTIESEAMTEAFLNYYDIFVRNAFGNYRNILKEVIFSPLMGEMLSFIGSRSTSFVWQNEKQLEFADENFAREVMQLFSIGLYKLRDDGTLDLDAFGRKKFTYTNNEISEYARLYTGFNPVQVRGNIENALRDKSQNPIDPMAITVAEHDQFPKLGLEAEYIGDGLPLCQDLPEGHFLTKGAKYRLLGRNDIPKLLTESPFWLLNPAIQRLKLDPGSPLFKALCNEVGGKCNFRGLVELETDLICTGPLCDIESLRVIEVTDGVYYEYARPACSRLTFYQDSTLMRKPNEKYYCENPNLQEGSFSCCGDRFGEAFSIFGGLFDGERVTFETAERRCQEQGLSLCSANPDGCDVGKTCDYSVGQWAADVGSCETKVKIDLEGRVAVVHSIEESIGQEYVDVSVGEDTKGFFRVAWTTGLDGLLSDYERTCTDLGCGRDKSDNFCLCDTSVAETVAFTAVPSVDEVLSLKIGAFPSALKGMKKTIVSEDLALYTNSNGLNEDTIFEVVDENFVTYLRKNVVSEVKVGESTGVKLTFRNPVHLMSFVTPELRDIEYEVNAAIDQYMYHKNTGPFLAVRFAKRFGMSNPSPRFVEAMSTAFQEGIYESDGVSFGSGTYGDLEALVACLLLDREARTEVLDADPASGSIFEPLGRLVRILRSMEYQADPDRPLFDFFYDLQPRIGQMPYQMLSVFSFFLPEYQPGGALTSAGLTCPECQELTAPSSISLMNGLLSLIKYGLEGVAGGFARGRLPFRSVFRAQLGSDEFASGSLKFQPDDPSNAAAVIERLSLLLTSGRLAKDKKELVTDVYLQSLSDGGEDEALINAMQLVTTTPEFHTNALSDNSGGEREEPESPPPSEKKYKAVVFLILEGGFDSFNMLVPERCPKSDIVEQYNTVRGKIGLTAAERKLKIGAAQQPCDQFSVHPNFPLAKKLYDSGDLSFIANAGVLTTTELDKKNYIGQTPFQLFAHNNMQREAKALDGFNDVAGTGVMGRMASVLTDKDYNVNSISIDAPSLAVQSQPATAPEPIILSRFGATEYSPRDTRKETLDIKKYTNILNGLSGNYSSVFGEQWSETFVNAISQSETFQAQLDGVTLGDQWPMQGDPVSQITKRLMTVSKLIKTKEERGVDRDFFYVNYGGWDHHFNLKARQEESFNVLNEALESFVTEMKEQNRFNEVTVVVTSDFGRTLTPNSGGGSDHAWGGNYLLFGGGVKGGKVLGSYPTDITSDGELNIGRGRLIPTTSWDCIWNGISQWMGVETDEELDYILPNREESSGSIDSLFTPLLTKDQMFKKERVRRR